MSEMVRWTARVLGSALVLLVVVFAVGEGLPRLSALSGAVAWEMGAFVVMLLGLVAAWKWPMLGGGIALAGLAAFEVVEWHRNAHLALNWVFALFAVAGLLHLLSGRPHSGAPTP